MDENRALLERIAAALERIAPPAPRATDWLGPPAFRWDGGAAHAVDGPGALPLDRLRGVDKQKHAVLSNLTRLAEGAASHDMLLWGARGMGKSALVRACVAALEAQKPGRIALVQLAAGSLASFPDLVGQLARQDRAFLLFIDDLGFAADGRADMLALRSLLDGGIIPRPPRVRIAVTSNRRAIVRREEAEAEALHQRDERDDALALADRFGLTVAFHPCDRETYLEILRGYTEPAGLAFDEEEALAFAIQRGNRSGRTALQFATELAGRAGKRL